ncbi:hypothetical protein [Massilia aerilata]|uniref:Lipocalin-like domain-containing protein n=1 Tax=Massilia aerilata TaxID=453817 RepID=A0ABW0S0B5_9BURK
MKGLTCAAIVVMLSGCGEKGGAEFVGSWQAKEQANYQATVERNGDNFLVKFTEPALFPKGQMETQVFPAVYKDGMLKMASAGVTAKIAHVKNTDTLVVPTAGGSMEYRRVK